MFRFQCCRFFQCIQPGICCLSELYLTDTITRPALVDYVKNMQIAYPYYEKQRKGK